MRIKTRLHLNSIIALTIILLMIISLVLYEGEVSRKDRDLILATEMQQAVFDRTVLRDEYLFHQSERAKNQWEIKTEHLRALLKKAEENFSGWEDKRLLEETQKDFDQTVSIFSHIADIHVRKKNAGRGKYLPLPEGEDRLISQILLKARDLNIHVGMLRESIKQASDAAHERLHLLFIVFSFAIVFITIGNSTVISRLLAKRLIALHEGAKIIGAGDLEHRISIEGNDELSDLAEASNKMSAKLNESHTSMRNLQKEMEERKRAEERISHLNMVLKAIRNVNQLIVREKNAEALVRSVCKILTETRGYFSAWIALFDNSGKLLLAGSEGLGDAFTPMAASLREGRFASCSQALREHGAHVVTDPTSECPGCPVAGLYKNQSAIAIRLEHGERIYGLLVMSIDAGLVAIGEEGQLIEELAADIAYALHSIEAEKQHRLAEASLQESEESFRTLAENANDGILIGVGKGIHVYANRRASEIMGYSVTELTKTEIKDLVHPNDLQKIMERYQKRLKGEPVPAQYETTLIHKDGREIAIELTASKTIWQGQAADIVIMRDITERRQTEEMLKKRNEEVRAMYHQLSHAEKLATMGEMAANIAHEINNPLATVSLRVESMLEKMPADDLHRRELEIIDKEIERMGNLVSNLLQFGRRGQQQISTVDVCQEIEKTLELIYYHMRNHKIVVWREFEQNIPSIHADRQQLRQMFLNLFTNAADAMLKGGTLTIRVYVQGSGAAFVIIEVTDTGTGIPPEILPKVMEPFYTTKPEGKGTGLGLSICRRIVQEHNGTLDIISEGIPGKGTTMRITLPVKSGTNKENLE